MKKILLSLVALATFSQAAYDDSTYKKSTVDSYQFGIVVGGEYTEKYEEMYLYGGIDTKFLYEVTTNFNIGARGAVLFRGQHLDEYDPYTVEAYVFTGYKVTPKINAYAGYGVTAWSDIENTFPVAGFDYYFNEDLIFEVKWKALNEDISGDTNHVINFGIIIPWNHY